MRVEQEQARHEKLAHDEQLQSFHEYVYAQLNSPRKNEILQRAAQRIQLWQANKLCSSYYIRFWSSVVKAGDSACWRRFKIEPPCRLNFEPGLLANL